MENHFSVWNKLTLEKLPICVKKVNTLNSDTTWKLNFTCANYYEASSCMSSQSSLPSYIKKNPSGFHLFVFKFSLPFATRSPQGYNASPSSHYSPQTRENTQRAECRMFRPEDFKFAVEEKKKSLSGLFPFTWKLQSTQSVIDSEVMGSRATIRFYS